MAAHAVRADEARVPRVAAAMVLAAISAFKDRSERAISALKRVAEARRSGAECQWTMAVAQLAR
jgi:hypothetical protein